MKVTLNWLKQYVAFDWSPEQLTERLTMLGLEVEGVHKVSGEFEGIVVGEVLTRDKVSGSDKLSVCRVRDGQGERQIICGANNYSPGDKVAVILPGAALPLKPGDKEPFVIKERKVFGVTSQGMMCSPQELGLSADGEGLLILRPDATVGQSFADYMGRATGDVVFDLEVTPNRPDLNSVIGIAREIAALTGQPLRLPKIDLPPPAGGAEAGRFVSVSVEEPDLCPRYTARVLQGVRVQPSPDWLRSLLEMVGQRSINNVVDVTNYVMLETGQPLHAFDYHLVAKNEAGQPGIVVRRAAEGEKFVTLDGQERVLSRETLLIADAQKGIALAGIMGGQNSEIGAQTADVIIESAYFQPSNVRRSSKALGLRTESSYRFERGADVEIADWASARCAQLILQTGGGQVAAGVVDARSPAQPPKTIPLRHERTNSLLGLEIPAETQNQYLVRLGLGLEDGTPTFRVPSFRVDLKGEIDLIEEIARLHGVDKIPATPPRGAVGANAFDAVHEQLREVRQILAGLGLHEAQGQTLIPDSAARLAAGAESLAPLANPLSSDMNVLRPSLLPGLLDMLRHNANRQEADVSLFEVGRVFLAGKPKPVEERRVALALMGRRDTGRWSGEERDAALDAYDLKGLLEEFLEQFGLRGVSWNRRAESTALFLESATVQLGPRLVLGELGQLLPTVARQYHLRGAIWLAEFNLDLLLARRQAGRSFKALAAQPAVRRDVAMVVPEAVAHEAVLNVVKQARPANLESTELFDVFRGRHVPAGHKSVAYAFIYRHAERTLTDAEVNAAHEKLLAQFKQQLQATVRDS